MNDKNIDNKSESVLLYKATVKQPLE